MSSSSSPSSGQFQPDIEGLRGLAVLLVVLYHAHVPILTGGFIGVDVFFVISGCLITRLLIHEAQRTGRICLLDFYARRARRLLPSAALTLAVTLIPSFFLYAPYKQLSIVKSAFSAALYASNLYFAHIATDYLAADTASNPFLHLWSLAVEEQFYFVWPLVIWFGIAVGKRNQQYSETRALIPLLSAVAIMSFVGNLCLVRNAQAWSFFSSPTRAWEFALGGLAQFRSKDPYPRIFIIGPPLGLTAIIACSLRFSSATVFPGVAALVPVFGTAAILHLSPQNGGVRSVLGNRVMRFIGRLSYSWYLWHWPLVVLPSMVWSLTVADRLGYSGIAFAVAAVTHRFVENPIRYHPGLVSRPWVSIALAICITFGVVSLCGLYIYGSRHIGTQRGRHYNNLLADLPQIYSDGCHLPYSATRSPDCSFGYLPSATTIVIFGDSHAAQWFPALEQIAKNNRWKMVSFTKTECPTATLDLYVKRIRRVYTECSEWREQTIQQIIQLHPAAVVLSNDTNLYIGNGISLERWQTGLRATVSRLSQSGVRTVLFHDPAPPTTDPNDCVFQTTWTNKNTGTCRYGQNLILDAAITRAESEAIRGVGLASTVDLSQRLCSQPTCNPLQNGTLTYRDSNHLTVSFVLTLTPYIHEELTGLLVHRQNELRHTGSMTSLFNGDR